MKSAFQEMMNGLNEVESFLAGNRKGFKVHVPDEVDVKRIRARLKMTQSRFSDMFGFSLDAIKHWEGGRRTPEAPARTLLTVIARNPEAVITALHPRAATVFAMKRSAKTNKGKKAREYAVRS
jgi:putative transcriptional regulator